MIAVSYNIYNIENLKLSMKYIKKFIIFSQLVKIYYKIKIHEVAAIMLKAFVTFIDTDISFLLRHFHSWSKEKSKTQIILPTYQL